MKLDLTYTAIEDLQSIRTYTLERWGSEQEKIYLEGIWNKFEFLQNYSSRCRFRHDLFPYCQIAFYEKHVILFRIRKNVLQIVRVLHSSMDFKKHL